MQNVFNERVGMGPFSKSLIQHNGLFFGDRKVHQVPQNADRQGNAKCGE